jgi:spoIIIJ-associated protein
MEDTKNLNDDGQKIEQAQESLPEPAPESETPVTDAQPDISQTEPVTEPEIKAPEPVTPEKIEAETEQVVEKLVNLMGIRSQARTKLLEDGTYYVNLRTRHSDGLLIGRRGMTIISIQALANQIMKHRYPTMPIDIFVDVSGYRKKHENFLKKKALAVAKIVAETNRDMALDLLTEKEFRMVQSELAPLGTVRVHAIGSGPKKTVIIAPITS